MFLLFSMVSDVCRSSSLFQSKTSYLQTCVIYQCFTLPVSCEPKIISKTNWIWCCCCLIVVAKFKPIFSTCTNSWYIHHTCSKDFLDASEGLYRFNAVVRLDISYIGVVLAWHYGVGSDVTTLMTQPEVTSQPL